MANVQFILDDVRSDIFINFDRQEISCNDIVSRHTNKAIAAAFSKACNSVKRGKSSQYKPSKIIKVLKNPIVTMKSYLPSTHQLTAAHLLFLRKFGLAITRAMNRPKSMVLEPIVLNSSDFDVDDIACLQSTDDCDFNYFLDLKTWCTSPSTETATENNTSAKEPPKYSSSAMIPKPTLASVQHALTERCSATILNNSAYKLEAEIILYEGCTPRQFLEFLNRSEAKENEQITIGKELEIEKIREENKPILADKEIEKIREENKPILADKAIETLKQEVLKLVEANKPVLAQKEIDKITLLSKTTSAKMEVEPPPTQERVSTRPATVHEVVNGARVEATSLPGRRVIGKTRFCGTTDDLRDRDVIHGASAPLVVTKTDIRRDPRVTYIAERVAHYREIFRRSTRDNKSFTLAKDTTATPELMVTIPNIIFLGKFKKKMFPRKLPDLVSTKRHRGDIDCFVGLFHVGAQQQARVMFRRCP